VEAECRADRARRGRKSDHRTTAIEYRAEMQFVPRILDPPESCHVSFMAACVTSGFHRKYAGSKPAPRPPYANSMESHTWPMLAPERAPQPVHTFRSRGALPP
jgi:hypothetical protein